MPKRWAVGFYSLFDNNLTVEIVEADTWYGALIKHSKLQDYAMPETSLEEAKQEAFNCDAGIDVVEIT